ncbi:MAG: hypothetical protein ACK4R9_06745 [Ignavibacterium sp.]
MKLFLISFSSLLLFVNACCSKPALDKDSMITIIETNCWLNLMPGGEPSFHYSGVFAVKREFYDQINFTAVKVYYKDEIIHQSKPILQLYDDNINDTTSLVRLNFYSEQGIKVTEKMMTAESADFHFIFHIGNDIVEKHLNDIPITRAY